MSDKNYIFSQEQTPGLLDLTGENIHKALTYIWKNYKQIQRSSIQRVVRDDQSLDPKGWDENFSQIIQFKIGKTNFISHPEKDKVDIFIAPKNEYRDLYSESGIYCSDYEIDGSTYRLTFKCEEPIVPANGENIGISILILRTGTPNFDFSLDDNDLEKEES